VSTTVASSIDYASRDVAVRRLVIFAVLAACFIICQCQRSTMAVLAPIMTRDLGLTAEDLGNMTSAFFLAVGVTQIPTGILFDRYGPRIVIGVALVLGVVGGALFTVGTTSAELIAGQALLGFGTSPVFVGSVVLIGRWWPPGRFATMAATMMSLGYVGNLAATAPFQWAIDLVGSWRPVFGVMIAGLGVSAVLILAVARDAPRGHSWTQRAPESLAAVAGGMLEVLRHPAVVGLLGAAMIGYSTNFAVRGLWAGPYLLDVHGMGADDRALLLMVMAVLGTGGIFVSGYLAGRLGTSFPVVIGFAGTGAAVLLLIGLVPGLALGPLIGLLLVFSSISNFFPAVLEHARRLFDDRLRGRSLTTINSAVFFGVGLTQLVTGNLIDAFPGEGGAHPEIAYRAMFIYVACVGCLGVGIYACFSRRGRRPHR
jgi:predicted MFS family arabinose efflux permease